jgi:hypothetical protein
MQVKSKWINCYEPNDFDLGDGWVTRRVEYCPVVEEYLKSLNLKEIKYDYEAYDTMHSVDGIVGKSTVSSRL